jgi:hypothetical protein
MGAAPTRGIAGAQPPTESPAPHTRRQPSRSVALYAATWRSQRDALGKRASAAAPGPTPIAARPAAASASAAPGAKAPT